MISRLMLVPMVVAGAVVAFFALAMAGSVYAHADFVVSKSTVAAYKVGTSLSESASVSVPAGKVLKLTKRPAGTTHVIKGPYSGRAGAYKAAASGCPWYYPNCNSASDGGVAGGTRSMEVKE